MHISRNGKCKVGYGTELDFLKEEQSKARKKYQQNYQQNYQDNYKEENKEILKEKRAKKYQENKPPNSKVASRKGGEQKAPYDPAKRRKKYEKEKEERKNTIKKISDSQKNETEDELYERDEKVNKFLQREENESIYKKKWYKRNAERLKKERKARYLKEKEADKKVRQKIFDAGKEERQDELEKDEEYNKFIDKKTYESFYKKEWYKANSDQIKARYNPSNRKAKYIQEKKAKAKMEKKINEGNTDDLMEDQSVHKFLKRQRKEKEYWKKRYQENAETIKKKKRDSYDPKKESIANDKYRSKRKAEEEMRLDQDMKKSKIMRETGGNGGLDKVSRKYNLSSRNYTRERYLYGFQFLKLRFHGLTLDEESHVKLSNMKAKIEELYQQMEVNINQAKETGLNFAKDNDKTNYDIDDLYKELHLKHCESWHGLQKKIGLEFSSIAKAMDISFICENRSHICPIYCLCCSKSQDCGDHKPFSVVYKCGLECNINWRNKLTSFLKIGLSNIKDLPLDQKQIQKFNEYEAQIHELYKKCENDVHNFFDTEEDRDRPKYGSKGEKAWGESPFREEIHNKWKELKMKLTTEFMDVTNSFGKS